MQDGEVVLALEAPRPERRPASLLRAAAAAAQAGLRLSAAHRRAARVEASDAAAGAVAARGPRVVRRAARAGRAAWPGVGGARPGRASSPRLIPGWDVVRSAPQRNALHRYTVDRHLVETAVQAASAHPQRRPARPAAGRRPAARHRQGAAAATTARSARPRRGPRRAHGLRRPTTSHDSRRPRPAPPAAAATPRPGATSRIRPSSTTVAETVGDAETSRPAARADRRGRRSRPAPRPGALAAQPHRRPRRPRRGRRWPGTSAPRTEPPRTTSPEQAVDSADRACASSSTCWDRRTLAITVAAPTASACSSLWPACCRSTGSTCWPPPGHHGRGPRGSRVDRAARVRRAPGRGQVGRRHPARRRRHLRRRRPARERERAYRQRRGPAGPEPTGRDPRGASRATVVEVRAHDAPGLLYRVTSAAGPTGQRRRRQGVDPRLRRRRRVLRHRRERATRSGLTGRAALAVVRDSLTG